MIQESIKIAAEKMLQGCGSVSLASINEDGYPRICEMEKVQANGLSRLLFITLKASEKVKHFRQNPKSGVGVCVNDDSISLLGCVEIIEQEAEMQALLPEAYAKRLERKGAQRYCILRFTTEKATAYIGGKRETYTDTD